MLSAILLAVVIGLVAFHFTRTNALAKEITKLHRDLNWYERQYPTKQGGTVMVPNANNYTLLSTNCGKDWYALDELRRIKGPAEEVYPGLLAHIKGMDALTEAVTNKGSLNLNDPSSIRLLEEAGFTIKKKQ